LVRVTISLKIPKKLKKALDDYCKEVNLTRTDALIQFIEFGINLPKEEEYERLTQRCMYLIQHTPTQTLFCAKPAIEGKRKMAKLETIKICDICQEETGLKRAYETATPIYTSKRRLRSNYYVEGEGGWLDEV